MRTSLPIAVLALMTACAEPIPPDGAAWLGTRLSERPAPGTAAAVSPVDGPEEVEPSATAAAEEPADLPRPQPMAAPAFPGASPRGAADSVDGEIADLIALAHRQAAAGDLAGAVATLRRAQIRDRDVPDVPMALGRIMQQAGRYTEAEAAFREVLRLSPSMPEALYGRAFALLKLNRLAEARGVVERLRTLRPLDVQVERMYAAVLSGSGEVDAALAARARIAEKEEGADARRQLGDALAREGRFDKAAEAFESAARTAPQDGDLQLKLGTALDGAGRLDDAEQALDRSTRLSPKRAAGWQALARVREKRGDKAGAARAYESLLRNVDGVDEAGVRARIERLRAEEPRLERGGE